MTFDEWWAMATAPMYFKAIPTPKDLALDAWEKAAAAEREACAGMCFAKATAFGKRADECDDEEDATELKARAWQMLVMGEEIAKRSNV